MVNIFLCAFRPSIMSFFGEMSVQFFCPFFNWVVFLLLSCISCLYILEIKHLSASSFEPIFSHSVSCLFVLFFVFFLFFLFFLFFSTPLVVFFFFFFFNGFLCCAKSFEFILLSLVYFCFYWPYSRGGSNKICCDFCWRAFCLCFPLGIF